MGQLLETKSVTKSFGGVKAIDNLDFHIEEGEILGIIGPNGSGKSTLFNLIAGFHKPSSGTIFFQGEDITGLAPHRIAKKGIIRSFQLNLLFSGFTVLQNIDMAYHLHRASGKPRLYNQAVAAPKDRNGKVKQFHEWKLSDLINVSCEVQQIVAIWGKLVLLKALVSGLEIRRGAAKLRPSSRERV